MISVKPSALVLIPGLLVMVCALPVAITQQSLYSWIWVLIGGLTTLAFALWRARTRFWVDQDRLHLDSGLIDAQAASLPLMPSTAFSVHQTPLERWLHVGSLTAQTESGRLSLPFVSRPYEVMEQMEAITRSPSFGKNP